MKLLRRWVLLLGGILTTLIVLGCTSRSRFPTVDTSDFITRSLGAKADVVLVANVAALLRDPVYAPLVGNAYATAVVTSVTSSEQVDVVLGRLTRAELYAVIGTKEPTRTIAVLRNMPQSLAPAMLPREDGAAAYRRTRTFHNEVREFAPTNARGWMIYVLPDFTWLITSETVAARVAEILGTNPASPPPLAFAEGALVGAHLAASFFDHARAAGWMKPKIPAEGAVLIVPTDHKNNVALQVKLPNDAAATQAEPDIRSGFSAFKSTKSTRDGDVVTVSFEAASMVAASRR